MKRRILAGLAFAFLLAAGTAYALDHASACPCGDDCPCGANCPCG